MHTQMIQTQARRCISNNNLQNYALHNHDQSEAHLMQLLTFPHRNISCTEWIDPDHIYDLENAFPNSVIF